MKPGITRIALFFIMFAGGATVAHAAGEAVNGFPNWAERVHLQWTNRARSDPQFEMASCPGANCLEATTACYPAVPPLAYNLNLNRAARFHSTHMRLAGYFAHNSNCAIRTDINSVYPQTCDGSASCACSGTGTSTFWATRAGYFGTSASSEIIARGSNGYDPNSMFYLWLYEVGDVATCTSTNANGHRYAILKRTGSIGYGYSEDSSWRYATGDFGGGTVPTKIVSGAHFPQQAASVEIWANWYDPANIPITANAVVDGVNQPMSLMRGTLNNGSWRAVVSGVATGCHRYYFSFTDATGTHRYPTTGTYGIGTTGCADWVGSAPVPAADTAGYFRASASTFSQRFTNTNGAADRVFAFGTSTDLPIVGDWDGNGTSTPGVFRNGTFLLRNSNTAGAADLTFQLGGAGDIPVAGDFNGDGVDTVGIFRNGTYVLLNANVTGAPVIVLQLGAALDQPVVGDFNGDGIDTTGIFRNGTFVLTNANTTGAPATVFSLGAAGDLPAAGDWNADGTDTVAIYRNGVFVLINSNVTSAPTTVFRFGIAGDRPVVGDWN